MQNQLFTLLGETDALHEPIRDWSDKPNVTGIIERRQNFPKLGLPMPRGGGDAAERKRFERDMDRLEQSQQVMFYRTGGRRTSWRLTDSTDWHLRRLCTCYDWSEALTLLITVQAFTKAGHVNAGCVPEWDLACAPGCQSVSQKIRERVCQIAGAARACQSRGWLDSWSDGRGVHGWGITEDGEAFLAKPTEPSIDWPEWSRQAYDVYFDAFTSAKESLKAVKTTLTNHVVIPLGCDSWPDDDTRNNLPAMFTSAEKIRKPAAMTRLILKSMDVKK